MANATTDPSRWHSGHVWKMPEWVEPVLIVSILLSAMFFTRRRNYSILHPNGTNGANYQYSFLQSTPVDSPRSTSPSPSRSSTDSSQFLSPAARTAAAEFPLRGVPRYPMKTRRLLGVWTVHTPNSSRFAKHFHSRILVKFPFLIEMFYWAITYFFYRLTAVLVQVWYGGTKGLWDVAQGHGIAILELEAAVMGAGGNTNGTERWAEWNIQQWFLAGAEAGDWRGVWLTVLNRCYALIHIPGTVGFIAYYYWSAPTFTRFATVRRTMSLLNLFAFLIFLLYPCMPPRLLPPEYGFVDTVNAEDAQSVWMSGRYVNKLAAMPSMHFGYAFCIGCVFVYESGVLQSLVRSRKARRCCGHHDVEEEDVEEGGGAVRRPKGTGSNSSDDDGEEEEEEIVIVLPEVTAAERRRPVWKRMMFLFLGVLYPLWILLTIVATANHYFMDALVATMVVLMSYVCNRALLNFLPLEDWLLWALRLEKPLPTTGTRERSSGGGGRLPS